MSAHGEFSLDSFLQAKQFACLSGLSFRKAPLKSAQQEFRSLQLQYPDWLACSRRHSNLGSIELRILTRAKPLALSVRPLASLRVRPAGFEPATNRLRGDCSTN